MDEASNGEPFIIAKAGRPLVKIVKLVAPTGSEMRRIGFMKDLCVPDDFDRMGAAEIAALFGEGRTGAGRTGAGRKRGRA